VLNKPADHRTPATRTAGPTPTAGTPSALKAAERAACRVRSGAIVTPAALPFDQVMLRRFGHPMGRYALESRRDAAA
jgi:hypothetical protein